jgi:hypothetical protein
MRIAAGNQCCYAGFNVLIAVAVKSTVVWDVRPYTSHIASIFRVEE